MSAQLWLKKPRVLTGGAGSSADLAFQPNSEAKERSFAGSGAGAGAGWGAGGGHFTWLNDDTEWMWQLIHAAERRMEDLVARYPDANGDLRSVLNQAARELLLLQSSDWPFLVTTGQAKEYATERFQEHLARYDQLCAIAERGTPTSEDMVFTAALRERDNPFPAVNYAEWAPRQGFAGSARETVAAE